MGGGPPDLVFPEEWLGVWEVQSTLTNVQIPLGPDFLPDPKVRPPGSFTGKAPSGVFITLLQHARQLKDDFTLYALNYRRRNVQGKP